MSFCDSDIEQRSTDCGSTKNDGEGESKKVRENKKKSGEGERTQEGKMVCSPNFFVPGRALGVHRNQWAQRKLTRRRRRQEIRLQRFENKKIEKSKMKMKSKTKIKWNPYSLQPEPLRRIGVGSDGSREYCDLISERKFMLRGSYGD